MSSRRFAISHAPKAKTKQSENVTIVALFFAFDFYRRDMLTTNWFCSSENDKNVFFLLLSGLLMHICGLICCTRSHGEWEEKDGISGNWCQLSETSFQRCCEMSTRWARQLRLVSISRDIVSIKCYKLNSIFHDHHNRSADDWRHLLHGTCWRRWEVASEEKWMNGMSRRWWWSWWRAADEKQVLMVLFGSRKSQHWTRWWESTTAQQFSSCWNCFIFGY